MSCCLIIRAYGWRSVQSRRKWSMYCWTSESATMIIEVHFVFICDRRRHNESLRKRLVSKLRRDIAMSTRSLLQITKQLMLRW